MITKMVLFFGWGQLFANFVGSLLSHPLNAVYAVRYAHVNCAVPVGHSANSDTAKPLGESMYTYYGGKNATQRYS